MSKMSMKTPARKVTAASLATAVTQVLLWIISDEKLLDMGKVEPEISAAITTITVFIVAYLVPPSSQDQVIEQP